MSEHELDTTVIPPPGPEAFAVEAVEVDPDEVPWDEVAVEEPEAAASFAGPGAVAVARGQVGVAESGGEDRGVPYERYVKHFGAGLPPSPWCAFFVSWCVNKAGYRVPWANPGYVPSVEQWCRNHGRIVATPRHGDMFGIGGSHMGFVAGANPAEGKIYSCEGNWSDRVLCRLISYRGAGIWFGRY